MHSTLIEHVASALRREILSGEMEPGTRLRQDDIARRLGVSHIPVREALRQLGSEGLVRIEPRRGAVVTMLSASELAELVALRQILEGHLLAQAIPKMTTADVVQAAKCLDALRQSRQSDSYPAANWNFHAALFKAAELPLTFETVQRLHIIGERYMRLEWDFATDERQHELLLRYAKSGRVEQAVKLLRRHIAELAERALVRDGSHPLNATRRRPTRLKAASK